MPTIDEKLEILNRMILDDATRSRDAVLDQLKHDAEQKLTNSKIEIDQDALAAFQRDTLRAVQEKDARISRANIDARKLLMAARNEIIASVLVALSKRLEQFTETDAYRDYLIKNVQDALARAGNRSKTPCDVLVTPSDYERFISDLRALSPAPSVSRGEPEIIGGCRVENTTEGIYVDNSFGKKVALCVDELFRISELTISSR